MLPLLDTNKVAGSLYGFLVGDALAMPVHWFYSTKNIRADYGELDGMVAPRPIHAESMVQGMQYDGTIDILHDKISFYEGNTVQKQQLPQELSEAEIAARRDEHGNFVGRRPDDRVHYHASLQKGQNTANVCIARLAIRYISEANAGKQDHYDPEQFLKRFYDYMTTPPDSNDRDQVLNHNDLYLDVYLRGFFTNASKGKSLRECALSQRFDTWSIGSLDGVVMSIPIIAAYAHETEWFVMGRAVEHHILTHQSITVTAVLAALVPLLLELYRGAPLKESLDKAMSKMSPPKITGRELADSYVEHRGPGNIPRDEKWRQHMESVPNMTLKELVHSMLDWENDEDVAGFRDRENSRFSTTCYCEHAFPVVLYLAYKYADSPQTAFLQNARLGGHSTARGAILGAIFGAAYGPDGIPFVNDLCAKNAIDQEIASLISTLPTSANG
jgi:ADP-ribosylglycohydrolase